MTYPKVKAVKGGMEIVSCSEAVHLQGHLSQKQTQEHKLCCVCLPHRQNQENGVIHTFDISVCVRGCRLCVIEWVWLTEGPCKPLRLIIVNYGHTQSVESHQTQNDPVEALSLHHAADEEADPLLLTTEVRGAVHLAAAFHAGSAKRRAGRGWEGWRRGERNRGHVG